MSSSLTRVWLRRIASYEAGQPIEKAKIGAFRKILCRGTRELPLSPELLAKLGSLFDGRGRSNFAWFITPEQTEQGLNWLKLPKIHKQLEPRDQAVLNDFSHFLFVNVQDLSTTHRNYSAPVYRVCSNAGPWFDYVPRPWQAAGCPFEIVGRG